LSLTWRQKVFYKDTVDVYRITTYEKDASNSVKQPLYGGSPVITGLKVRIQTTQFRNSFTDPLGRSQNDNFFTEDQIHCESGTDIRDGDIVVVTNADSALVGLPYKVIGKGEDRHGWANYNHFRIRLLSVKPASVP